MSHTATDLTIRTDFRAYLLPPLHVFGAPLVVDVEESFAGAPGLRVNISVIELVPNNTVGLRVEAWQHRDLLTKFI